MVDSGKTARQACDLGFIIIEPWLSRWPYLSHFVTLTAVLVALSSWGSSACHEKNNGARKVASVHKLSISNTFVEDMWSMTQLSLTDRRFTDAMAQTFVPKCANHFFFIDTFNHWKLKVQKTRPGQFCSSTFAILTPKMRKLVDKIQFDISLVSFFLMKYTPLHFISIHLPQSFPSWQMDYTHFLLVFCESVKNLLSCAQCTKTKGLHGRVGCFALFGCSPISLIHSSWLQELWSSGTPPSLSCYNLFLRVKVGSATLQSCCSAGVITGGVPQLYSSDWSRKYKP